jgi:hypothetical protein
MGNAPTIEDEPPTAESKLPVAENEPPRENGYDRWRRSMLKQVGNIERKWANDATHTPIPRAPKSAEPIPGATYWIALHTSADLIKGFAHRWRSSREYQVDEFEVWKSLELRHTYEVQMRNDDDSCKYRVTSAQEVPAPKNMVGERPWED